MPGHSCLKWSRLSARVKGACCSGATLVELLVALAIGVMIVAVVMLAHQSLTRNASQQSGRMAERSLADHTIQILREPLQQLFYPPDDPEGGLELENSATNLVRLAFCRWDTLAADAALPTNRLERVVFEFAPVDERPQLVMMRQALTGPLAEAPASTNWAGKTWPRIHVHLYDGDQWHTNWPSDAKSAPRAARIQLLDESATGVVNEAIVVIPAGLSVTSTLPRTGTSAVTSP